MSNKFSKDVKRMSTTFRFEPDVVKWLENLQEKNSTSLTTTLSNIILNKYKEDANVVKQADENQRVNM